MPAEPAEPAEPSWRDPDVVHETGPPRMPVPGEAPCADASITAPTEDSTEALHTADAEVPDGMLNDSVVVSTTVVAGIEDTDGLSEGVTEGDTLNVTVKLVDDDADNDDAGLALTEILDEEDATTELLAVCELDADAVGVGDALIATLDDTEDVELTDDDTLTLDDALDEGDVE